MAVRRNILQKFLDDLKTKLCVLHFAAAKFQRYLYLHILAEEVNRVRGLHAKIVRINPRAQLHFLHCARVLMLFGFLFLLRLLVTIFAVVHEPAHRRRRRRCDLHQVHAVRARLVQGVT